MWQRLKCDLTSRDPGRPCRKRRSYSSSPPRSSPPGGRMRGAPAPALWEDDFDPAVLRLAHALRGGHSRVVLAAATDRHVAARNSHIRQRIRDVVGTPYGEPLVVTRRPGEIGIAGDLDANRAARLVRVRRLPHDIHARRGDFGAIPVEEDQEDLNGRRRSGRGDGDRRRGRRRCEAVYQAGDEVVCAVPRAIVKIGVWDAECRLGGGQVAVVEIQGQSRVEVVPDAGDTLVAALPGAVVV